MGIYDARHGRINPLRKGARDGDSPPPRAEHQRNRMSPFQPGDKVNITRSKCGYTGKGTVVCRAYGFAYLVRVDGKDGGSKIILVRAPDMRRV